MRLLRRFGAALSGAVLAFVLPLSQAQAQDCVRFNALNHCGVGAARLSLTDKGVLVENDSDSGADGVAIYTGPGTSWSAASFIETDAPESKTVFSSVSEGTVTSSVFIHQKEDSIAFGASFGKSGGKGTYSVSIYLDGVFKASYSKIQSGLMGPVQHPSLSYIKAPSCRPIGQTYMQCMNTCRRYSSCNYCSIPCGTHHVWNPIGVYSWSFALAYPNVTLPDGQVVEGDELVITEDVDSPGSSAPACDEIRIQTTAKSTTLFGSSVVREK